MSQISKPVGIDAPLCQRCGDNDLGCEAFGCWMCDCPTCGKAPVGGLYLCGHGFAKRFLPKQEAPKNTEVK